MHFGALMFLTDYSMKPVDLARALEARGFESFWTPEHSHIPASRRTPYPMGGELPKEYYHAMDPFVTLTAAAVATKTLKVGTGICLLNQRDPIQTAKEVATIDQVSDGRFLFGIGIGWNQDEMENHGSVFDTRAKLVRERIEAMKEIWTKEKAEYHGEFVNFDPVFAWPKPVQKPYPPIFVGGGFPHAARRAARYGDAWAPVGMELTDEIIAKFQAMVKDAGRDPGSVKIDLMMPPEDLDALKRYRDKGINRVVAFLPSAKDDEVLPILDRWAELIRKI
jgi:probable F420-dependent oxidoreductase